MQLKGLEIFQHGHRIRLKWHRLRRSMCDPLFSPETMRAGFKLGASMEIDLRVRGDGGFAVLHDEMLEGETTGSGLVRTKCADDFQGVTMRDGGFPVLLTENLAAMLQTARHDALLQFDMKDDYQTVGRRGIVHLAEHFAAPAASIIISGDSLQLIAAVKENLPDIKRGIDPSGKLAQCYRSGGWRAVEAGLSEDICGATEPHMVYLHWKLVLRAARDGLDLLALCRDAGKQTDAWTFTLKDPDSGFSDDEWRDFSALAALKPDQITTDEAAATERAWLARVSTA